MEETESGKVSRDGIVRSRSSEITQLLDDPIGQFAFAYVREQVAALSHGASLPMKRLPRRQSKYYRRKAVS